MERMQQDIQALVPQQIDSEAALAEALSLIYHWYPDGKFQVDDWFNARMAAGVTLIQNFVANGHVITNTTLNNEGQHVAGLCIKFFGLDAWRAAQFDNAYITDEILQAIVIKSPEWIIGAYESGVRYRVCQDADGQTLLMRAARMSYLSKKEMEPTDQLLAENCVRAYLQAEGPLSDLKDNNRQTEAHVVVGQAIRALEEYVEAGGKLTDEQDKDGYNVPLSLCANTGSSLRSYIAAGGKFYPVLRTIKGHSEAFLALRHPQCLEVYLREGSKVGARLTGITEHDVLYLKNPEKIKLFFEYGGRFSTTPDAKIQKLIAALTPEALQAYRECLDAQKAVPAPTPLVPKPPRL